MLMFRCQEEGVPVSEELYPAVDETNPLLKNKKVSQISIMSAMFAPQFQMLL